MNAVVTYESMFGNTKEIACAIAEGIGGHTRVVAVGDLDEHAMSTADLLVVGAPTHAWSMPRRTTRKGATDQGARSVNIDLGVRERLPALGARRCGAAVFDTRIDKPRFLTGSAAKSISKMLRRLGYTVVGTESFLVADTSGPLVAGELDRAKAWGESLRAHVGSRSVA
jgi:hypothetical protein